MMITSAIDVDFFQRAVVELRRNAASHTANPSLELPDVPAVLGAHLPAPLLGKGGFASSLPDPARYIFIKYSCSEQDHVKYL